MAGENDLIEISVLSGQSERSTLTFTPGTPANPVSVGTAGQWVVLGDGVNPVHVYLVFDGRNVHAAAAAPNMHVLLAGTPVGTGWARAPVPCELRFGGVCLIMRFAPRTGGYVEEERTVHDGGALWHAAQRAVQDAVDKARQGPSPEAPPLGGQFPPPRPAAGMPSDLGATIPMDNQLAFRDAAKTISSAPPPADDSPTTVRATAVGAPPAPPPVAAPAQQEVTMIAPQPLMPRPGYGPPPGGPSAAAPPGYPPAAPPVNASSPPVAPGPSADTNPGTASATNVKGYWQSASPVKKATLVLMPFALVMSYLMLQPEAPPPPPKVIAAAGSAAKHAAALRDAGVAPASSAQASTSDASDTASAVAAGASGGSLAGGGAADAASDQATTPPAPLDGHPEAAPKLSALPPGKRTPERLALDAVAAGSFDEASKQYAALAAAHPDDPSYKEAARILRDKTAQPQAR
ncbi:MAG: hypothetical protein ACLQVI_05365 [Polyangiaceae bacterium]|jgi:hypothetical protein